MVVASGSQNLRVDDDGLMTPEVGGWAETKYRLLALYDELFSTGMKNKWDQRVYLDLYAGAGCSRIQGTSKFLKASPIIALTVAHPFDKYIFCEEREDLLDALKARVKRIGPQANVAYIPGNCDSEIEKIYKQIPKGSSTNKVLSLCLVDPFTSGSSSRPCAGFPQSSWILSSCLPSAWMRIVIMNITLRAIPRRLTRRLGILNGGNAGRRLVSGGATSGRS